MPWNPGDSYDPYNKNDLQTKAGCVATGEQLAEIGRVPEWRSGMSWDQYQGVVEGHNNNR